MPSLPATYKTFVYEKYGPIEEVLKIQDVPMEPLAPTSVRIHVHSAALNPADHLIVEGAGQRILNSSPSVDKPYRIGFDVAGVVAEVGTAVETKFHVGDEVYAMAPLNGMTTVAEYVVMDVDRVAHKPASLDFNKAAAIPAVSLTSYQAIAEHAKLQRGERVLVIGGSTSVAMYAIQHAKMLGAYVIATASTKKIAFLTSIGADEVIDYTTTQWSNVVEPHSVDVIYECGVEKDAWDAGAQLVLKQEGSRFVTVIPGPPPSEAKFGAVNASVFCYPSGAQLTEIAAFIDAGKIHPVVDSVFPFEKTVEALTLLKTRRVLGKIVIQIQ